MATHIGKAQIVGLSGAALGMASVTGYVSPNMQSLKVGHQAEVERIKNQVGEVTTLISSGDYIECSFDFIPEGGTSTDNTIAKAKLSASLPATLAAVTITGLPIIQVGPFTDALNTNPGNTQPWIYEGGGELSGPNSTKWTLTFTLRRYINITSATPIT